MNGRPPDTHHLVCFALADQRYALDLDRVRRSNRAVAVTPLPGAPAIVLGVIDLAGELLPVVDIRQRFGHPSRPIRLSDQLLIAQAGARSVALLVDETRGVLEASKADLVPSHDLLPKLELIAGAVKLPDGLVLIHDLERLLSLDEAAALERALEARKTGPPAPGAAPTPEAP